MLLKPVCDQNYDIVDIMTDLLAQPVDVELNEIIVINIAVYQVQYEQCVF